MEISWRDRLKVLLFAFVASLALALGLGLYLHFTLVPIFAGMTYGPGTPEYLWAIVPPANFLAQPGNLTFAIFLMLMVFFLGIIRMQHRSAPRPAPND